MKITPSKLILASKCPARMILSVVPDHAGQKIVSKETSSTMRSRFMGIYFEACLFGERDTTPPPGYAIWLTSTRTKQTRDRIKLYADKIRPRFDLDKSLVDVTLEVDLESVLGLRMKGIADHIGKLEDTVLAVTDVKFTKDIYEAWDITEKTMKLIQSPFYSVMYAILNGDTGRYMELMDSLVKHRATSRKDLPFPLFAEIKEWVASSPTPIPMFLIVESTYGSREFIEDGELSPADDPLTKKIVVSMSAMDYFNVPFDIARYARYYEDMIERYMNGNLTSKEVDPTPQKCLGKGTKDGMCPYLHACPFAREVLYGTQFTNLNNIF